MVRGFFPIVPIATLALAFLGNIAPVAADLSLLSLDIPVSNCYKGCTDVLNLVTFSDIPKKASTVAGECGSELYITSTLACLLRYCNAAELNAGWASFTAQCLASGGGGAILPAWQNFLPRAEANNVTVVNTVAMKKKTMNETIVPSEQAFLIGLGSENSKSLTKRNNHIFGWTLYILFGIAVIVGLVNRLLSIVVNSSHSQSSSSSWSREDGKVAAEARSTYWTRFQTWYRKRITVPALLGYRHAQPWGFILLPTRLQSIFIFCYIAINFIFACVGYDIFLQSLKYSSRAAQISHDIADRTGVMCIYNLPILWLLGGRNDVFLWVTGWSYSSASLFHRYVAILSTLQAIVHAICYTWYHRATLATTSRLQYWATGVVAVILMSLLLPLSNHSVRKRSYEVFLLLHIAGATGILIMLFYHLKKQDGDYNAWLWTCVTIWVFDRFIRICRFTLLSFRTVAVGNRGNNAVLYGGESEASAMRLVVTTSIRIHPTPGHYFFLYTPRSFTPWENHPFTLASWNPPKDGSAGTELHFLIAPSGGGTRRLHRMLTPENDFTKPMRILLEGPYGHHHCISGFQHVLLVAGGSGITGILPYFFEIQNTTNSTKRVTVLWAARSPQDTADVRAKELLPMNSSGLEIASKFFYTSPPPSGRSSVETVVDGSEQDSTSPPTISKEGKGWETTVSYSRPIMVDVLREAIDKLVGSERLAVLSCGPAAMMDDLRSAVCASYGVGEGQVSGGRLEYFEDAFNW